MEKISATWTKLATSDHLQRSSHVVSVVDGDAYISGGELLPRQPRDNHVYKLNLKAKTAQSILEIPATSASPSPRVGSSSATLHGKIYIFSGRGGEAMTPVEESGSVWEFDPTTSTWTLLSPSDPSKPFPLARSYHCSASDAIDQIYIHAGCPASGRLSDLWSFHPATRTWLQLTDAPGPARGGTSIAFHRDLLYRMNGFDGITEQGGSLDVYDPARNTWSSRPYAADGVAGPAPRSVGAIVPVVVAGRYLLVALFGEGDPSAAGHLGAGKMWGDVWAYDVDGGAWARVEDGGEAGERPAPRGWFDADVVGKSEIVVVGGLDEANQRLNDVWLLSF